MKACHSLPLSAPAVRATTATLDALRRIKFQAFNSDPIWIGNIRIWADLVQPPML